MPPLDQYKWELYHIAEDYSESNDLAASHPDKLKEMQALFHAKRRRNTRSSPWITPASCACSRRDPSAIAGKTVFTYTGENPGIPMGNAPSILGKDYTITAELTSPMAARRE